MGGRLVKKIARCVGYVLLLAAIVALAVFLERCKRGMYAEAVANEIERREKAKVNP